ncbi:telomere-protecting terminal protein Tpg, partial [Streptomyces sp. H39-C1]
TLPARINYLLKQLGTAKAVAQELGITADSVNRYRRGARKNPPKDIAAKIDNAVRQRWQPQVRKRRQRQAAATTGVTVETRARFGYTAPVGTTDDGRFRRLTVHLPPAYAQRLFDARNTGASDQQMRGIIAEGFKEVYFQDGGGRATGLSDVTLNDIDYLDLDY